MIAIAKLEMTLRLKFRNLTRSIERRMLVTWPHYFCNRLQNAALRWVEVQLGLSLESSFL